MNEELYMRVPERTWQWVVSRPHGIGVNFQAMRNDGTTFMVICASVTPTSIGKAMDVLESFRTCQCVAGAECDIHTPESGVK